MIMINLKPAQGEVGDLGIGSRSRRARFSESKGKPQEFTSLNVSTPKLFFFEEKIKTSTVPFDQSANHVTRYKILMPNFCPACPGRSPMAIFFFSFLQQKKKKTSYSSSLRIF